MIVDVRLPEKLTVDDMDLSIVLGNALDNAIEACERMKSEEEEKSVHVMMKYINENILLSIKNSYDSNAIKTSGKAFLSAKRSNAELGIGMENIQNVIQKYNGNMSRAFSLLN